MRPAGDVSQSLLAAVDRLMTPERAPTLQELAAATQVGVDVASSTLKNLTRAKRLCIPRTRRVEYRNRPVAEYARLAPMAVVANQSVSGVTALLQAWG